MPIATDQTGTSVADGLEFVSSEPGASSGTTFRFKPNGISGYDIWRTGATWGATQGLPCVKDDFYAAASGPVTCSGTSAGGSPLAIVAGTESGAAYLLITIG